MLQAWLEKTAQSTVANPETRTWCLFNIQTPLTFGNIHTYFDDKVHNAAFTKETSNTTTTNQPIALYQMEVDNLHALNKMVAYRHQGRIKHYRDDLENKDVRTYSSLSLASAKFNTLKKNQQPV